MLQAPRIILCMREKNHDCPGDLCCYSCCYSATKHSLTTTHHNLVLLGMKPTPQIIWERQSYDLYACRAIISLSTLQCYPEVKSNVLLSNGLRNSQKRRPIVTSRPAYTRTRYIYQLEHSGQVEYKAT